MKSGKDRYIVDVNSIEVPEQFKEFVSVQNGLVVCDSLQVAEKFGVRHDNMLQTIDRLIAGKGLRLLNNSNLLGSQGINKRKAHCFRCTYLDDRGRKQTVYRLNQSGFMAIGMSARSEAAKKWRQDLIEAFQIMQDLMVEEANRRLRKLTRPRTRIRVPVYNAWDNKYYTVDTKIKNYTPVEMAIIRKAGTAIQIRRMAANLRKWEKEHNNGESVLKYMPSVHRPTDKSGKFKEAVPETMLRVRKLPKFLLTAFKRKDYVLQEADEG